MSKDKEFSSFIIETTNEVIRDVFKRHEHGDLILPFVVLKRIDSVLLDLKPKIIEIYNKYKDTVDDTSKIIHSKLNVNFSNYSNYDLNKLTDDPNNILENINEYLNSFSPNIQEIIKNFSLNEKNQ